MPRFNTPPGWPAPPPGWTPPPSWQPDPSSPPAPAGWSFWLDAAAQSTPPAPRRGRGRRVGVVAAASAGALALVGMAALQAAHGGPTQPTSATSSTRSVASSPSTSETTPSDPATATTEPSATTAPTDPSRRRPRRAPSTPATPATAQAPAAKPGTALAALATLRVAGRAPKTGYDRARFGQAWADVDRNGCDTRNDVLRRDLTRYTLKAGTHGCLVLKGTLHDPYTGRTIAFVRGQTHLDRRADRPCRRPLRRLAEGRTGLEHRQAHRLRQRLAQPARRRRPHQRQQGRRRRRHLAAAAEVLPVRVRRAAGCGEAQLRPVGDPCREGRHRPRAGPVPRPEASGCQAFRLGGGDGRGRSGSVDDDQDLGARSRRPVAPTRGSARARRPRATATARTSAASTPSTTGTATPTTTAGSASSARRRLASRPDSTYIGCMKPLVVLGVLAAAALTACSAGPRDAMDVATSRLEHQRSRCVASAPARHHRPIPPVGRARPRSAGGERRLRQAGPAARRVATRRAAARCSRSGRPPWRAQQRATALKGQGVNAISVGELVVKLSAQLDAAARQQYATALQPG